MRREYDVSTYEAKWDELKDRIIEDGKMLPYTVNCTDDAVEYIQYKAWNDALAYVEEIMDGLERTDTVIK